MKARKGISGLLSAVVLVASLPCLSASAAGDVAISVSKEEAAAGKSFSVDVSIGNIPSPGLNTVEFAIEFDSSVVTIDSVSAGALCDTGAAAAEAAIDASMQDTTFGWNIQGNQICVTWSTGLTDYDYWLSGEGVFCTVTGTVKTSAAAGAQADFSIVPIDREAYPNLGVNNDKILVGYVDSSDQTISRDFSVTDGYVKVAGGSSALYGDVDCNGSVSISDVVLLARYVSQDATCPTLSKLGIANADCSYDELIDANDISTIARYLAGLIKPTGMGPQ